MKSKVHLALDQITDKPVEVEAKAAMKLLVIHSNPEQDLKLCFGPQLDWCVQVELSKCEQS